jgi:hypothetical protein
MKEEKIKFNRYYKSLAGLQRGAATGLAVD